MELWGNAVRWGANHKAGSAQECCKACKKMCGGEKGECLCDSWVYCGDKDACGNKFGECWLKKQKDSLDPDRRESGDQIMWTSGIIYGKGEVHNLSMQGIQMTSRKLMICRNRKYLIA
uniref:Apple domain-containing protein n=1 Tax=Daucus carota subsp. sativus TaxID=79200 RepID=A0A175YF49_DAUCS